jgi:hypothetical protein
MEELITTVIVVLFTFGLNVKDTVTHQTQVPAFYEVEKSNNISEVRPLPNHHLHGIQKGHLTGKRAERSRGHKIKRENGNHEQEFVISSIGRCSFPGNDARGSCKSNQGRT